MAAAHPNPFKILILEDNPDIASELGEMIQELGYQVSDLVKSYPEALESVKKNPPDLALCDIKIHGYRDGIETARAIREVVDIPIIYLTAFFENEIKDRALLSQPHSYLLKPVHFNQLGIALEMALHHARLAADDLSPTTPPKDHFYAWVKGVYEVVRFEDVIYLEAENVATKIISTQKVLQVPSKTLGKMLEEYPHPDILRVSRSQAVHLKRIQQFDKGLTYLLLDTSQAPAGEKIKQVIYVTASYRDELKRRLGIE